jgi:peptidyl-prolyl cis-trans isomerase SurA
MNQFLKMSLLLLTLACAAPALAQEALIATVNDHPITAFDVDQRIKLLQFRGERNPAKLSRKAVANSLIDDIVTVDEAKLGHVDPTDKELDEQLGHMAEGMKTDQAGLKAKLSAAGLSSSAFRDYVKAQMAFGRLLQVKFHEKVAVDQAEVDKKFAAVKADISGKVAKIESDPRRQPVKVISLQEVNFPVDGKDPQLLQSRAIEANQASQKIKSCSAVHGAIAGIFNVQVGRKIEADSRKLPPPLKVQLETRGIGHAIGPMRYPKGIQLLVYCGSRMIVPPKLNVQYPTRDQIEIMARNEKYDAVGAKYAAILRKNAVIEYKDPSYAP